MKQSSGGAYTFFFYQSFEATSEMQGIPFHRFNLYRQGFDRKRRNNKERV